MTPFFILCAWKMGYNLFEITFTRPGDFLMYRKELEKLESWWSRVPRKPLVIRGARQVGKIEYLHMGPLVFSEFLAVLGEKNLLAKLQGFQLSEGLGEITHKRCLELLRSYLFVGGMPEAVDQFVKTGSARHAAEVHRGLLETYRDDFPKYIGSRNLARFLKVFSHSARSVMTKVKYSNFSGDHQSATIKADIELLCLARILSKVTHSHCNGLPLESEHNEKVYKLLFLDVGLMNAMLGLSWSDLAAIPDLKLVNEGPIAEQFVGQHLLDAQRQLRSSGLSYWLREGRGVNAEVDFVTTVNGRIVPIEVKAGASGSLRSLHQLMGEKDLHLAVRLDLNPPSLQSIHTKIPTSTGTRDVHYQLLSLPLYLVERLPELVGSLLG